LRFVRRIAEYPNRIAGALLVGLVIAICVNALLLQQSRHPAPLFHKSTALAAAPLPQKPQAAPVALPAQPTPDPIDQLIQSTAAEPAVQPQEPAPRLLNDSPAKPSRDPISQLLKSDAAQIAPEPSKTVFAAQRALVKLGFVLKPDGVVGEATRQAIEQFERGHGLPVRGELSAKVLQDLSARSGIAIE
jgi:peptidoglycan hydrolase-like protein with peptidoglycan-binding domain